MAKKKTDESQETEGSSEVSLQAGTLKVPELEVFKKISMLSSLASACENEALLKAFQAIKHGDRLYELFVKAVHGEIQAVVSGKEQQAVQAMGSVQNIASHTYETVQTMYNMMSAISNSPIMKVLAIVHDRMTGSSMEEALARAAYAQAPIYNRPPAQAEMDAAQAAVNATAPAPQQPQTPQQSPGQNPPLTKKYAASRSQNADKVVAPSRPPRGNDIAGIF